jgi:peptide/nickel transport system permease protein
MISYLIKRVFQMAVVLWVVSIIVFTMMSFTGDPTYMMEVMKQDFIKFARAKGATFRSVLFRHALKNVLIPVVTIFGLQLGDLIGFATITEYIFAWPGMGKLLIDSIYMGDRPVIVVYLMFVAFLFVIINFAVDVIYTIIDPRIKLR